MKLVRLALGGNERIGIVTAEDRISLLDHDDSAPLETMEDLIRSPVLQKKLSQFVENGLENAASVAVSDVSLLAPVKAIEKVICVGKNYLDHALEMGGEPPEIPVIFSMFPSAIIGTGEAIRLPAISEQVDFEAELVVVVGKRGKNIPRESALEHVFGYCCGNDVSARDWQKGKPGGQWLLGKTFDTFAPLGPYIVTRDDVPDPQNLDIRLRLNGSVMQQSNTRQQIFPVDYLIAHISQFVTLVPGDLIFTGTPSGVGAGRKPPIFLKPGDQVEVEIEGLGVLTNPVVVDR